VKSPGRVNLIGEHTDYNEGFVLPAAVDKNIILALSENNTEHVRLYAVDKDEMFESDISGEINKSGKGWPDYLLGVVDQLRKHGYNSGGFDCVFGGNVPIGAGMSSSAALESGVIFGLNELFDLDISPVKMALIAQKAENEFVGVQCGIMDQFVSLNGKGYALKLDCRSLEYEFYPFKRDDIRIVLCDTQIRRELASSEYNTRRQQCEEGVKVLQKQDKKIQSLRDVSLDLLNDHKSKLDPVVYERCKFVIEENQRVLDACNDLKDGDYGSFGERMHASHEGLRDQYEVSCKELDVLVDEALKIDGVLGSRMMGGGFGGCTINLVEQEHLEVFKAQIRGQYQKETGKKIKIYQTKVSGGTHLIQHEKQGQIN
jgi:galactokinase